MHATTSFQRSTETAAEVADLERLAFEVRALGDFELADAIKAHANLVRRSSGAPLGAVTLRLRSGRLVPLREVRRHIRRSATPARAATVAERAAEFTRQAAELEAIHNLLNSTGARANPTPEMLCWFCGRCAISACICDD